MKRALLAVLCGTVIVFVWGAFSHMVLLTGFGFSRLPDEQRVLTELKSSLSEDGLYFFPGTDLRAPPPPDFEAKFFAGPTGLLLYHPGGEAPVSGRKLGVQLLGDLLASAICVALLSSMLASYWRRVLTIASLGAFSCLTVSLIFWNWYGFPHAFFAAQVIDMVVGWALAGAAMARLVPSPGEQRRQHLAAAA